MHSLYKLPQPTSNVLLSNSWKPSSLRFAFAGLAVLLAILCASCVAPQPGRPVANAAGTLTNTVTNTITTTVTVPDTFRGMVTDLNSYALPTPAPTSQAKSSVVINTDGIRANVRSGPGTNFSIIAKVNPGSVFNLLGKSADAAWLQICCLNATTAITTSVNNTGTGWVASSISRITGPNDTVISTDPLLKPDLQAQWQVDWQCSSERCQVKQCAAVVNAKAGRSNNPPWLSIDHQVTWNDTCFATDNWNFEVDPNTGKERSGEYADNFLYSYWLGQKPGAANGVYTLKDGRAIAVWCSGPYKVQIEEGNGWTTAYEGNTCHDVRTGMLVLLSYNKRWLFTGKYQGQTYDHAYFGDNETLEQKLVDTNATLFLVKKK